MQKLTRRLSKTKVANSVTGSDDNFSIGTIMFLNHAVMVAILKIFTGTTFTYAEFHYELDAEKLSDIKYSSWIETKKNKIKIF